MAKKIDEIKARFGGGDPTEYEYIVQQVEKYGHVLKNVMVHHKLGTDTIKKLKKEGFSVEFDNNCYVISGW